MHDPRLTPSAAAQPLFNLIGGNPRPVFSREPGWHPHIFTVRMDHIWRDLVIDGQRVDCQGTQHLLLPAPAPGATHSAHFDPQSPYFQAYFTMYVAAPINGRRVPIEAVSDFGRLDNLAWLRFMGDPDPLTELVAPCVFTELAHDATGACTTWLCTATNRVHSDLGPHAPRSGLPALLTPPASGWSDLVESYQPMDMVGHAVLWYQNDHLLMNYFNGIAFTTRDGRAVNTYADDPGLRDEFWRMAGGLKMLDSGAGFRHGPQQSHDLTYGGRS